MAITRVLITVKTYPTISTKYEELVCTAGFLPDGSWIRIYPVQFRKKDYAQQYSKYQCIEMDLVKNTEDFRPESYRPVSHDTEISILGSIGADGGSWDERRKLVMKKVYTNLADLIAEAKDKSKMTSLAVFKPTEVKDLKIKAVEREWDKEKLESLKQLNIFETFPSQRPEVVRKLPYEFSYEFVDDAGKKSTLMIEDWEIGQLFWNCLKTHQLKGIALEEAEKFACTDVRTKYLDDFAKTKDLHFYLGTAKTFHLMSPNPFLIIGTFHAKHFVPKMVQGSLF